MLLRAAGAEARLWQPRAPSETSSVASSGVASGMAQANLTPCGGQSVHFLLRVEACSSRKLWLKCQRPTVAAGAVTLQLIAVPQAQSGLTHARRQPLPPRVL